MAEVLEIFDFFTEDNEKSPMKSETTIVVTSQQESYSDFSEEDSVDEYSTEYDFSNLGQKLLCPEAEAYDKVQQFS